MKKLAFALTFLFLFAFATTQAQYAEAPNGLAFRWVWSNYQFPINGNDLNRADYNTGVEIAYWRHIGKYTNLAIPLKMAKTELPLDAEGNVDKGKLAVSLDALLHLKLMNPDHYFYPYLLGGVGVMSETEDGWKMNPEFPVGLGINFRLADHFYASAETQYRFGINDNRSSLQHAAGVLIILGGKQKKEPEVVETDRDKDGILDKEDQCPDEPGYAVLFGCRDRDGDGVADRFDDCPDEPGPEERKGCPIADRDNDGVADADDRCPDNAGDASMKGCPDQDSDGLADIDDKCPTIAGLPQFAGCPDTDSDGVADPQDKCPNTPGPASNNGCPELAPEEKEVLEFATKAVQFETGSAKLLQSAFKTLDEIAAILIKYPDYKCRIGGHTDSIGEAEPNQKLSERRVKTCYDYLVSKGVKAERISYEGFGETKPIGDNRFKAGRDQNRRVEFDVYIE